MRLFLIFCLIGLTAMAAEKGHGKGRAGKSAAPRKSAPVAAPMPVPQGESGTVEINVTDVLGNDLAARVELLGSGAGDRVVIEALEGHTNVAVPRGVYKAHIYVYVLQVPVLVDVQDIEVKARDTSFVLLNQVEGASGNRSIFDFDQDHDFAIDKVELKCGTNPRDAASIPGKQTLPMDERVLAKEAGWYCGELHAHSSYGVGKESVAELVKRAEKDGLDFLAIADRNSMAACMDPAFKSDSVVLIPALEWGNDEKGVALIYGARTFPEFVDSVPQAQALVDLVLAQGGFFAIAHPCFPNAPWQWGLGYVNGVEIWCREWRAVPPMSLDQLGENLKERYKGKLVHSIAFAAASPDLSANGQAAIFYDCELVRGLKAGAIAGSCTGSPAVPMAEPVTYVNAVEKSVKGILDGLLRGRTFVSNSRKGPKIDFKADVLKDGTTDVSLGGIVPLQVPTRFLVNVENAKGADVQVLLNGQTFISKTIENNNFAIQFDHDPENYAEYRVRVVAPPRNVGFGSVEVLATSSPIYAQSLKIKDPKVEAYLKEKSRALPSSPENVKLPTNPHATEIVPKWKF